MGRGRPIGSEIRQRMVEVLYFLKEATGYDIYKVYKGIYPNISLRSIYYHLKKGLSTGEFIKNKVRNEKGEFSWGNEVEKVYYSLGREAKPKMDKRVKEYLETHNY
ncbi:MAG: hypothetical protein ACQEP1_04570 [Nanobdellota archaeon]